MKNTSITIDLTKRLVNQMGLEHQHASKLVYKLEELEKVRLWAGLRFIENKSDILTFIFFLESLTATAEGSKSKKLQKVFVKHATKKDKMDLVTGYLFSKPYVFGKKKTINRHSMFKDFEQDIKWQKNNMIPEWTDWKKFCSAGNSPLCFCNKWLLDNPYKIDQYTCKIIKRLYEMRCAVVHDAFPVTFVPEYKDFDSVGMTGTSTIVDAFPLKNGKFVSYECSLRPSRVQKIFISVITNFLTA